VPVVDPSHRRASGTPAPADAHLAADAGTLSASCGEHVEVAGVGVAPAQVAVQRPAQQLPNTEPKLRDVFGKLKTKFGTALVIVDQPAPIDTT
jgi:hypothetical protein